MKLQCEAPMALVVAGYDPSGGAGVVSDLRAMEQRGVLGQGVVTGNTFQNDLDFVGVEWCEESAFRQLWLAGGLGPYNLAAAVAEVAPDLVDLNSKIEKRPGFKDIELFGQCVDVLDRLSRTSGDKAAAQ